MIPSILMHYEVRCLLKLSICVCVYCSLFENAKGFPIYYARDEYDTNSDFKEILEPSEIQNAMCNIVTDQIKATANATITRQLKGVCHSKEMREQFRHLETVFIRELHKIHKIVHAIMVHQTVQKPVVFKYLANKPQTREFRT